MEQVVDRQGGCSAASVSDPPVGHLRAIEFRSLIQAELPGRCRVGWGISGCHHGEIMQGADRDPVTNRQRVLLVTLRTPWIGSHAVFRPMEGEALEVRDGEKKLALESVRLTLDVLGRETWGGLLDVRSLTRPSRGFGTSTSDCLASVRAACDAFGVSLAPDVMARILFLAERASDPLMYRYDVLYRSREGLVHEQLGGFLPPVAFVGLDTDPDGAGVLTHMCPHPCYADDELEVFKPLIGGLRHAVAKQDPLLLGRVATASAKLNQRYLPMKRFDDLLEIMAMTECIGIAIAHTGTLASLLFDPRSPSFERAMDETERHLRDAGFSPTWRAVSPTEERERRFAKQAWFRG